MNPQLMGMTLRAWQHDALSEWDRCGRSGVVEAVTGTGKTAVGLAATADALARGRRVLILVPGVGLMEQWYQALTREIPNILVGRRGAKYRDRFADVQVLVGVVQSVISSAFEPLPAAELLLVADEAHRYGAASFSRALFPQFSERLGLTATFERNDDGIERILLPYFRNTIDGCDYARAKADDIIAPVRVMTVGVPFSPREYAAYAEYEERLSRSRYRLITEFGCCDEPFGVFLSDVEELAKHGGYPACKVAQNYLSAFSGRKTLLSSGRGKMDVLGEIGAVLSMGGRSMVFTETKESCQEIAKVLVGRGVEAKAFDSGLDGDERVRLLEAFKSGEVDALAAPKVLDEGIDVAEADLGVIMAGSRTRRQMIQRMGRVIRPKSDGRHATFVVLYMQGSVEDPARGAHEEFLSQLLDVADTVVDRSPEKAIETLAGWFDLSAEQVRDNQQSYRVLALRELSEGRDVTDPVRPGDATQLTLTVGGGAHVEYFDQLLTALSVLNVRQLKVLGERFGLGTGTRKTVREVAAILGLAPEEVVRAEDEALARMEHPDVEALLCALVEATAQGDGRLHGDATPLGYSLGI